MVENNVTQQVELIHTIPKMTQTERKIAEQRVANDLYVVLSDIYKKLDLKNK